MTLAETRQVAVLVEINGWHQIQSKVSRKQNQGALGMAAMDKPLHLQPCWPTGQCWAHLSWRPGPALSTTDHLGLGDGAGCLGGQEGNRTLLFKQLRAATWERDGSRTTWDGEATGSVLVPQYMGEMATIGEAQSGMDSSITKDCQAKAGYSMVGVVWGGPSHRRESGR